MLLSHQHFAIEIISAPNPKDIIWYNIPWLSISDVIRSNVSIPQRQIFTRKVIADTALIIGAIFWSIVVTFVSSISNLELLSQNIPWIQRTELYHFLNNYMAIGLLLAVLSSLPILFDFISRSYEGIKLESEIQNSILARYFYYQLANVFVAVGLGSIATRLNDLLNNPSILLSLLGSSVPSFSIYFMNLVVIKTFTAVPLELLRPYQLSIFLRDNLFCRWMCSSANNGVKQRKDPPILYGWVYPNLLMVLMIMVTYSSVSDTF